MRTPALALLATTLLLAGCVATPADEPVDGAAAPAAAAAPLQRVAVAEKGSTPPGGYLCTPVSGCVGESAPGHESSFLQAVSGRLVGANLTATWAAAAPTSEQLVLGISWKEGDEWKWEVAEGASPLVLSTDSLDVPAGSDVYVYLNSLKCAGGPAYACAGGPEQEFEIAGDLLVEADAAAAPAA